MLAATKSDEAFLERIRREHMPYVKSAGFERPALLTFDDIF